MEAQKNKTTLLIMATGTGFKFGSLKQLVLLEPQKNIITLLIYDAVGEFKKNNLSLYLMSYLNVYHC